MSVWRRWLVTNWITLSTLLLFLIVLAGLQYRWSAEASEAARERTRRSMLATGGQIKERFTRQMLAPCEALRVGAAPSPAQLREAVANRMTQETFQQQFASVLQAVYLAFPTSGERYSLELLTAKGSNAPGEMPAHWDRLKKELNFNAQVRRSRGPGGEGPACMFDGDILMMHHTVAVSGREPWELLGYVILAFSPEALRSHTLPALLRNLPGEPSLRAAVLRGRNNREVLYTQLDERNLNNPDVAIDLLAGPGGPQGRQVPVVAGSRPWQLLLQHGEGSLEQLGYRIRWQNAVLGMGVVLLLGANIFLLVSSTERARDLARTQVSFVAGVSHELRTPVTAVRLVADNLATGLARTPEQVRQYGELLQQQGNRLATMVDDILQFADFQRRPLRYELKPVPIDEAIAQALEANQPLIQSSGVSVTSNVQDGIPAVMADATALVQCLNNLLNNALKYGDGTPVVITAATQRRRDRDEVVLAVRNGGPGIPARDRELIFESFYRGAAARASQTPGSGLGLSLVRQMVTAMNGSVSVESEPGAGATFSISLPAADKEFAGATGRQGLK